MTTQKTPARVRNQAQIGAFMKRFREDSGRTVDELCGEIGCTRGTLWRFEAGKYELSWVVYVTMIRLEHVYGPELGLREALDRFEEVERQKLQRKAARRPAKRPPGRPRKSAAA